MASAASTKTGGQNPDIVLHLLDGLTGSMDPAFMAHCCPIQFWALAHWETWFQHATLARAFSEAALKLGEAKGSWWSSATGPTTAVLATCQRLGWQMPSPTELIDDLGNSWILTMDSPVAVVQACKASAGDGASHGSAKV